MRKLWYIIPVVVLLWLTGCGVVDTTAQADSGIAAVEQGQYEAAIGYFTDALKGSCDERQVYRGLGIAYLSTNRYEESIQAFQKALSLSNGIPENVDYDTNYYLAQAFLKNGDGEEAVKVYDAILKLKPGAKDAYYYRGLTYLTLGEEAKASEDFAKVTAADPKNFDNYFNIYCAMVDAGYEEDAKNYLSTTLANSQDSMTDYDKGRFHFYLGNYSDARVWLDKAKDMNMVDTILMLGRVYEEMEDFNYAASVYNSYLSAKGNDAKVYNQLGICKMKTGDYQDALIAFTTALELEDVTWKQTLLYNEATAYEYLGEFATAREKMKAYLELYPTDEEAIREYDFLKSR